MLIPLVTDKETGAPSGPKIIQQVMGRARRQLVPKFIFNHSVSPTPATTPGGRHSVVRFTDAQRRLSNETDTQQKHYLITPAVYMQSSFTYVVSFGSQNSSELKMVMNKMMLREGLVIADIPAVFAEVISEVSRKVQGGNTFGLTVSLCHNHSAWLL